MTAKLDSLPDEEIEDAAVDAVVRLIASRHPHEIATLQHVLEATILVANRIVSAVEVNSKPTRWGAI